MPPDHTVVIFQYRGARSAELDILPIKRISVQLGTTHAIVRRLLSLWGSVAGPPLRTEIVSLRRL